MKKHITYLYILIIILLISQVITLNLLIIKTNKLSDKLNNTYIEIKSEQFEIQNKINQISENLKSTQSTLSEQLAELKATTSSDFSGIIEQSVDSIVTIITDTSQGTGFIIHPEGFIVTNAHVLTNANYANVITADKQTIRASLIGLNSVLDIALLKIPGNYQELKLGNSDNVKVGEKVIAIGNPLGLQFSATEGIISALDRVGPNRLPAYLQTDVALNPGNSGGPLINKKGEVIGINNFKLGGFESLGFALESNFVKTTINQITSEVLNQTIIN